MSLCHIPLGAALSKRRSTGLGGLRAFGGGGRTIFDRFSSRRTLPGLALNRKQRLSRSAIRRTPRVESSRLSATICVRTSTGSFGPPGPRCPSTSPAAPRSLYFFTQLYSDCESIPISLATRGAGIPSSTCSRTAFKRNSGLYVFLTGCRFCAASPFFFPLVFTSFTPVPSRSHPGSVTLFYASPTLIIWSLAQSWTCWGALHPVRTPCKVARGPLAILRVLPNQI
jgi:hypothetical protein